MKAIFAGTFDPFTEGHAEIARTAAGLFTEVVIAIAHDTGRSISADIAVRRQIAAESLKKVNGVTIKIFSGLLTDFLRQENCVHLVRGLRDVNDFLYEQSLCSVYKSQMPDIVPVYLFSSPRYRHVSGTIVRELAKLGGDLSDYIVLSAQTIVKQTYKG